MAMKIVLPLLVCFALLQSGIAVDPTCNYCQDGTYWGNLVCLLRAILGTPIVGNEALNAGNCISSGDNSTIGGVEYQVEYIVSELAANNGNVSGCFNCGDNTLIGTLYCRLQSINRNALNTQGKDKSNCAICGQDGLISSLTCLIGELAKRL